VVFARNARQAVGNPRPLKTEVVTKLSWMSVAAKAVVMTSSFIKGQLTKHGSVSRKSCSQGRSAHQVQHALQVVSHRCQAHLGSSPFQSAQKKTGMAEDGVFENGERMLHRASS